MRRHPGVKAHTELPFSTGLPVPALPVPQRTRGLTQAHGRTNPTGDNRPKDPPAMRGLMNRSSGSAAAVPYRIVAVRWGDLGAPFRG